ncbi:serine/threonine protein kinase PknA [Glycomyces albus]
MDIGTLVAGRYRLDRPIAAGGMGEVWRGFDTLLERRVAVKILHRRDSDPDRLGDRFGREARILASLRGPGLVEVYDYGQDSSGGRPVRYIVMELVEGISLADVLDRRGPLPSEETLRYVAATAAVLDVAHGGGVVHRDIKPANLLIEPDGRLRLVDFGISLTDGGARLTLPGGILGTTSYVSPEQLNGREVGGAADLYSLGAVAYECLAGRPPFVADDQLGVVQMHLYEEPPPLPDGLPPAVVEIVARCLRKDPEQRWPSAAVLAASCRLAADTAALPAAVVAGADRRAKDGGEATGRHRRRSWPAVFMIAVLLVLAAIGLLSMRQLVISSGAESQTEAGAAGVDRSTSKPPAPAFASPEATDDPSAEPASSTFEPSTAAETEEESPEPSETSAETAATGEVLPDVLGVDAAEAQQYLNALGWTDVRIVSTLLPGGSQPEGCEVVSQNPKPDRVVGYDHPVKIAYWGLHDCP